MKQKNTELQFQVDDLDRKILQLITKNARIPFLEVARETGVSGAAIHQRVQRLQKEGIIKGSEFIINAEQLGYNTCAFMGIYLDKTRYKKSVAEALQKIPEITECHFITGPYVILVKIQAKTNKDIKRIIDQYVQEIDGIARTETFISLEEIFVRQVPIE